MEIKLINELITENASMMQSEETNLKELKLVISQWVSLNIKK